MTRRSRSLLGCLVLLGVLVGCGGEPSIEDYCEQLDGERERFAQMISSNDPGSLLGENLAAFEQLGELSPRDLQGEWDTFLGALQELDGALSYAGVEADDFADGVPDGLDDDQRASLDQAVQRLESADVVESVSGIETQARDVCKVNIGL